MTEENFKQCDCGEINCKREIHKCSICDKPREDLRKSFCDFCDNNVAEDY